jgi:chromosome segregation ATPase
MEKKIKYLESILKETQNRLRECETHTVKTEQERLEAVNRLEAYEKGDYQLQEAVGEIKNLKNQIKLRDRDIEKYIRYVNKLDYALFTVLEEDDELRAQLGLDPRKKLNLEEMNDLRAVKSHENRAIVHVLKKEVKTNFFFDDKISFFELEKLIID